MASLRTSRRPGPDFWAELQTGAPEEMRSLRPGRFLGLRPASESPQKPGARGSPSTASRLRADAALSRVAQIQSRIRSRLAPGGCKNPSSRPTSPPGSPAQATPLELGTPSDRDDCHPPSRRFLKQCRPLAQDDTPLTAPRGPLQIPPGVGPPGQPGPLDSDEEDMKRLLGSLAESSRGSHTGLASPRAAPSRQVQVSTPVPVPGAYSPQTPSPPSMPSESCISSAWSEAAARASLCAASDDSSLQDFLPRMLDLEDPDPRPAAPRPQEAGDGAEMPSEAWGAPSEAYSPDFEETPSLEAPTSCGDRPSPAAPSPGPSSAVFRARQQPLLRESAVQTLGPPFDTPWTQETVSRYLATTYTDPMPVASLEVGAELVEALSARSPAALALHQLLAQQLSLTRGFLDTSRHLHAALLQGLDTEAWRYHSLEEAQEFIRLHRPPPLSMEEALCQARAELEGLWQ